MSSPSHDNAVHPLSYEARQPRPIERLREWLSHRSYLAIGLPLMLLAMAAKQLYELKWEETLPLGRFGTEIQFFLLFAALFLPGAIRQLNWRKALLLAVIAAAVCCIETEDVWKRWDFLPYPAILFAWIAPVVGACHWLLNPPRRTRTLAWTMALTFAAAFILPAMVGFVDYRYPRLRLHAPGIIEVVPASYFNYWPLLSVLVWLSIPAARRIAESPSRKTRALAIALIVACPAWFILFFCWLQYPLAAHSLEGAGPFTREQAVLILTRRTGSGTDELFWQALESADWSWGKSRFDFDAPDYRLWCVQELYRRGGTAAARRLAALLKQSPSEALAQYSALILANEHCYEATPELMRYTLIDDDQPFIALQRMQIPQAAFAILREEAEMSAITDGRKKIADYPVYKDDEDRLAKLLGKDVGPKWGDWIQFYFDSIEHLPTPLSPAQASETNRVIKSFQDYWTASDHLKKNGRLHNIPGPNFDVPGTEELEREIEKYKFAAAKIATAASRP
jgi:hypothetical protein